MKQKILSKQNQEKEKTMNSKMTTIRGNSCLTSIMLLILVLFIGCGKMDSKIEDDDEDHNVDDTATDYPPQGETPKTILDPIIHTTPDTKQVEDESLNTTGQLQLNITEKSIGALPSMTTTFMELVDASPKLHHLVDTENENNNESEEIINEEVNHNSNNNSNDNSINTNFAEYSVKQYFAYECRMGDVSYCPENLELKDKFDHKFTTTTLIGQIYHAEMYAQGIPMIIEKSTPTEEKKVTFVAETTAEKVPDTTGNPYQYIYNMGTEYDYVYREDYDSYPSYYAFNEDEGAYSLSVVKKFVESKDFGDQNFILQIYISQNEESDSRVLALNSPSISSQTKSSSNGARVILLVNFETRRFISKYRSGDNQLIIIGQAGRDLTTGELLEGYFYSKVKQGDNEFMACWNNQSESIVDDENCATEKGLLNGSFDVVSYMGLNSQEETDLVEFTSELSNGKCIADNKLPLKLEDLKNFPDKVKIEGVETLNQDKVEEDIFIEEM